MVWEWGAPVSALTVNDNVVRQHLPADRAGDKAFVQIAPFAEYYKVDNRVMTTPAAPARVAFTSRANQAPINSLSSATSRLTMPARTKRWPLKIPRSSQRSSSAACWRSAASWSTASRRPSTRNSRHFPRSASPPFAPGDGGGGGDGPRRPAPDHASGAGNLPIAAPHAGFESHQQSVAESACGTDAAPDGSRKGNGGTIEAGLEVVRGFLLQAGIHPRIRFSSMAPGFLARTWLRHTRSSGYSSTSTRKCGRRS